VTYDRFSTINWPLLALIALTGTFVGAIPVSCMPVLFKEISDDLGLDLVQVGTIWGVANLAGIFVSIIGGVIADRFKLKRVLAVFCILVGITGALRGISDSFFALAVTVFINGIVRLVVPIAATKAIGVWFRGPRMGTAMGVGAMGIGLGLTLGPMISATVLSPLLGGWRNVMYFYGVLSTLVGVAWVFAGKESTAATAPAVASRPPVFQTLSKLLRLKAIWVISLGMLFRIACIIGVTGYLPIYLRGQGWTPAAADGTLAIFYALSAALVIPLSLMSDRLHSRRAVILPAAVVTTVAVGLLPLAEGAAVWVLAMLAGMFLDGFMSIIVTTLLETEEIGPAFSGTALGMIFAISQVGAVVSPPIGNSLADFGAGTPFFFWAGLSLVSLLVLLAVRETAGRARGVGVIVKR
jgi:MFS family permease